MGYYKAGDPIPDWCPLREQDYLIQVDLNKSPKRPPRAPDVTDEEVEEMFFKLNTERFKVGL